MVDFTREGLTFKVLKFNRLTSPLLFPRYLDFLELRFTHVVRKECHKNQWRFVVLKYKYVRCNFDVETTLENVKSPVLD